jgi:hypothetical protein
MGVMVEIPGSIVFDMAMRGGPLPVRVEIRPLRLIEICRARHPRARYRCLSLFCALRGGLAAATLSAVSPCCAVAPARWMFSAQER